MNTGDIIADKKEKAPPKGGKLLTALVVFTFVLATVFLLFTADRYRPNIWKTNAAYYILTGSVVEAPQRTAKPSDSTVFKGNMLALHKQELAKITHFYYIENGYDAKIEIDYVKNTHNELVYTISGAENKAVWTVLVTLTDNGDTNVAVLKGDA